MAKEKQANVVDEPAEPLEPHVVTPAQRQGLQKCYEQAIKLSTQEKGPDYDYAHALFSECVTHDPGNLLYVEAMLDNLERKFKGNKKGARLSGFGGARGTIKKAAAKSEWRDVLAWGPDALKSNPWDVPTLRHLARACAAHHYNEAELRYLKNALDANPKDLDVNRHCAESLTRMGQFDQAIACWRRIEEHGKAGDKEEAAEKISDLTIERARGRSGLPGEARPLPKSPVKTAAKLAATGVKIAAAPDAASEAEAEIAEPSEPIAAQRAKKASGSGVIIASLEEAQALALDDDADDEFRRSLEKAIAANPADAGSYVLLADLLVDHHRYDQAEELLSRGLAASGRNLAIVDRMEDLQIERAAHRLAIAEKQAQAKDTEDARRLVIELKRELNRIELSVFRDRVNRYPEDKDLQFELGLRLKRAGSYEEAVACFEQVGDLAKTNAAAALELGEAFHHLKRFHDALINYIRAARLAGKDDPELRKKALYRGGVLATGMRRLKEAEAMLRELQALDPHYKDLPARLDKIGKIRDSG